MTTVEYSATVLYRAVPGMRGVQPAAEVTLHNGDLTTNAVAIFDSGSPFTVFSPEHAQLIGIDDVTTGSREQISTLGGGRFEIYLFPLEIELLASGPRFAGQIGFLPLALPATSWDAA